MAALHVLSNSGVLGSLLSFLPDRQDWENLALACKEINKAYVLHVKTSFSPWPTVLHSQSFQMIDVAPCQRFILGAETDGTLCILHQRYGVLATVNVFDTVQYQNSIFAHPDNPWKSRRLLQCLFQRPEKSKRQSLPSIVVNTNRSEIHLYEIGHPFNADIHDIATQRGNFGVAISIGGFSLGGCLSNCGCYVAMNTRRGIYNNILHPAIGRFNADYAYQLDSTMDTLESWQDRNAPVSYPGEQNQYHVLRLHPKAHFVSSNLEITITESGVLIEFVVLEDGKCVLYNPCLNGYNFVKTSESESDSIRRGVLPKSFQKAILNNEGKLLVRAASGSRVAGFYHTVDVIEHGEDATAISEYSVPDGFRFSYVHVSFPYPPYESTGNNAGTTLGHAIVGLTTNRRNHNATHVLLVDISTGNVVQSYGTVDLSNSKFFFSNGRQTCKLLSSHRSHPSRGLEMMVVPGVQIGDTPIMIDAGVDPPITLYDYQFEEYGDY